MTTTYKVFLGFGAAALLFFGAGLTVLTVHAEDALSEQEKQQLEAQKKEAELRYEAQKKAAEAAGQEAQENFENAREAEKQRAETEREAQKQRAENAREALKNASSTDIESEEEDSDEAEHHRNQVADIVRALNSVAQRESGIGEDVRVVARAQASSSEEAVHAIRTLKDESKFKKFILGPNYKSIGELRSTIVATQNHIDRLTQALTRVSDPAAKATVEAQITALEDVASSTQAFVSTHEDTFSLLGWLVRMMNTQ